MERWENIAGGAFVMARGKSPSFQFYATDWLSSPDILMMTPAEEGAYIRLLAIAWLSDDCGLPDDDGTLAGFSRLGTDGWECSRLKIRQKFRASGGRIFNDRLLEERQKQAEWREKSSKGGCRSVATKRQAKLNHPSTPIENKRESQNGDSRVVEEWLQPNGNSSVFSSQSSSSSSSAHSSAASENRPPPPIAR